MTPLPRSGPRPLALHMAMEGLTLQAAMAALTATAMAQTFAPGLPTWNAASPNSSPANLPLQLVAAAAAGKKPEDITGLWSDYLEPARFLDAVVAAGSSRLDSFVRGVRAYQQHPHRRTLTPPPAVWARGAATLHDYGGEGPAALFVPSLINKAYILDLAADRSLLRATAAKAHVFLLDWGTPGTAERAFAMTDYIQGVLIPALEEVKARTGAAPRLVGYCMGGTLAVAPAVLRPDLVSALALLAAPWDFAADGGSAPAKFAQPLLETMIAAEGVASVDLLQALFASLDPTLVGRKFRRFAELDPASEDALRFVALEDWLNDGVPLAGPVARECLFSWYGENTPATGRWQVGGVVIDGAKVACPSFAFLPAHDRIVPPASAAALADAIPGARRLAIDLGHIGMVAAALAPRRVYQPLADWLASPL